MKKIMKLFVIITDISGVQLAKVIINSNHIQVPTNNLKKGIYIASMFVNGKPINNFKLIK
jgi:hypothetical protein